MVEKQDTAVEPRTDAMADRVEAARLKIQTERESRRKDAPKITAQLLQGVDYIEDIVVKMINGDYGILTIHPLGEGDIIEAFDKLNAENMADISTGDVFNLKNYDFFWTITSLATGLPKDLLKKKLAVGESPMISERVLAISGMSAESEKQVESFLA